ncbi:hypothetical protein BOSEA1005_30800 [Hyphomicrobiales bacterium]|nr:hypothetical protein BOSEA1005_30800 [Hyphomicrobiales bacterium]CAI0347114.1 hypothetical protein BO1005MUT1_530290 [Hyphomicrobiales bacterium]
MLAAHRATLGGFVSLLARLDQECALHIGLQFGLWEDDQIGARKSQTYIPGRRS